MYDFVDEKSDCEETVAEVNGPELTEIESVDGHCEDVFVEQRRMGEFSFELHGKAHPDALYRAAGGEVAAGVGRMLYGCPCCGRAVGRVLRVRATRKSVWMAVCAMCAAATLAKHPEALIGGVVRGGRGGRRRRAMRDAG